MSEEYGLKFVVNGEDYDKIKKSLNEQIKDLQQKVEQLEKELQTNANECKQLENIRKEAIEELSYMSTDAYVEDYDIREKHYNLLMNILNKGDKENASTN